jgi:hypothetical protein
MASGDVKVLIVQPTPDIAGYNVLQATTTGNGASRIGIEDSAGNYTSTNVENALKEISDKTIHKLGGLVLNTKTLSDNYQILSDDFVLRVDSNLGVFTLTLPDYNLGQIFWICNIGADIVNIAAKAGDTIIGSSSVTLDAGGLLIIQCTAAHEWNSIVG